MNITQLSYCSRPAPGVTAATAQHFLKAAGERNQANGISGFLLFRQDFFAQVLEGSREAVSECFLRISADVRHLDIQILGQIETAQRRFQNWSMGYLSLTHDHIAILQRNGVASDLDVTSFSHAALVESMAELAAPSGVR